MPTIVQITDIHVHTDPAARLLGVPTWDTFDEILQLADAVAPGWDRLVLTGDLAQDEAASTYDALVERLGDRLGRTLVIPGNHDDPSALAAAFPGGFGGPGLGFSEVVDGWLLVGVDSHVPGVIWGRVDADQCARIQGQLDAHPGLPTVLFIHHPPTDVGAAWLDGMGLKDVTAFHALVQANAGRIHAILCGHVHQDVAAALHGVPVLTTPSTAFQFAPGSVEPALDPLPPGFRVVELGASFATRVERAPALRHAPVQPGPAGY